jgi:aspartyl-tRNA(Asn)/glutamyl-tRNA(Gln) amidotransferase subunit A
MTSERPGDPSHWSLEEIQDAVVAGRVTPYDVVDASLRTLQDWEPVVGAFTSWDEARLNSNAADTAERLRRGTPAPLDGVVLAVKDNIQVAGRPMTAGSSWWQVTPTGNAECWQALETAGAMYLGQTNLHEFAFGATNVNLAAQTTRNPWDPERAAGGSSGGSAVAVAIGACGAALGTDTGGSVRIPAALTGVTGFKPTYGRVPLTGVVPLSPSCDHVGVLSRTATGCARVFGNLPGQRRCDTGTWPDQTFTGRRIGVLTAHLGRSEPEVVAAVQRALTVLEDLGAELEEAAVPNEHEANAVTSTMVRFEAAQVHRKWLQDPAATYGADVRARLEEGLSISADEYRDARRRRGELVAAILDAHQGFDAVAGPTVPITAPTISSCVQGSGVQSALLSNTYCYNVTGQPAISVPCGRTSDGLPVGLQLAAGLGHDHALLELAVALQRVTRWHTERPVLQRSPA